MISRIVLAIAALAIGVTTAAAQDVVAQRKDLMKASGAQARIGAAMVKGEQPFELAKAQAIFTVYADKAVKMKTLFPESSKAGDHRSLPAIWEKPAEWNTAIDRFANGVKAAQASTKDLDSFKAAFEAVGKDCGACHQPFRKPQS
jgi:cytochrome c556